MPESGVIRIDGIDHRDIKLESLRRNIGVVFQDSTMFYRSIGDNLRIGKPDATQAEIEEAAKLAEAHDFIMRQPQGYETLVGERGTTLSGGERQRLAIARALLKNPPILILDEATSALDSVTEARIQKALKVLMQGRTTFVIAHRLSTIRDADQVVVLEHGRIAEQGRYAELIARGGVFSSLVATQRAGIEFCLISPWRNRTVRLRVDCRERSEGIMSKGIKWLAAAAAVVLLGLPANAQTSIKFTLDWVFQGPTAPFLVALEKGYYKAEGLDVTMDPGQGSAGAVQRVATGAYQIGFADVNATIEYNAKNPGKEVLCVFMAYDFAPFGVYALKKSGIKVPKDLEGKKLGAPVFDASFRLFPAFAKKNGITKWEHVNLTPAAARAEPGAGHGRLHLGPLLLLDARSQGARRGVRGHRCDALCRLRHGRLRQRRRRSRPRWPRTRRR